MVTVNIDSGIPCLVKNKKGRVRVNGTKSKVVI